MLKLIVRREHNDRTHSHGQRKEQLHNRLLPHLGVQQLAPLGSQQEPNAIGRALQRNGAHEQRDHNDVRKQRQEVGRLAGALHAPNDDEIDGCPRDQQTQDQFKIGRTKSAGHIVDLMQHFIP